MVQVIIDEQMQKKLLASDEIVELVDESGKLLGRILPELDDPLAGWEPITPELSDEELKRLSEYDGPGISTRELIGRLRAKP